LPDYPASSGNYYLKIRPFLAWDSESRSDLKRLIEIEDDIRSMNTYQILIMVFSIIMCIVISIILTFSQVYNLMGKDVPCIQGDGDSEQEKIKFYKKCLGYGGKLIQAPFAFLAFIISNNIKGFLSKIATAAPSDDITNKTLKEMSDLVETKVWRANLTILVLLFISVIIDIIFYFYNKGKDSKSKVETHNDDAK
jgi:hypothetical protein